MNLNKFLINPENDDTLQPVNSQFSGIFKKSSLHTSAPKTEISSNEFLAPKRVYSSSHSFPHKSYSEESFENVFGSLDINEKNILLKVSRTFNNSNGSMTFQR